MRCRSSASVSGGVDERDRRRRDARRRRWAGAACSPRRRPSIGFDAELVWPERVRRRPRCSVRVLLHAASPGSCTRPAYGGGRRVPSVLGPSEKRTRLTPKSSAGGGGQRDRVAAAGGRRSVVSADASGAASLTGIGASKTGELARVRVRLRAVAVREEVDRVRGRSARDRSSVAVPLTGFSGIGGLVVGEIAGPVLVGRWRCRAQAPPVVLGARTGIAPCCGVTPSSCDVEHAVGVVDDVAVLCVSDGGARRADQADAGAQREVRVVGRRAAGRARRCRGRGSARSSELGRPSRTSPR